MIYFIVFFLLLCCSYNYDYRRHANGRLVAYGLICLFLIAIAGLRYRIGNDSIIYENLYKNFPTLSELPNYKFSSTRFEPGYIVISSISRSLSPDFTYFQILHAFIINPIIFWFIYRNTRNIFLCATLYFVGVYFNFNTEVLREALAVCCFLIAWPYFREGKWLFYYIVMVVACFFHISATAMLLMPLFALPGIRFCFKLGLQTLLIAIAIFAVSMVIQRQFFGLIQEFSSNTSLIEKAQFYGKSQWGGSRLNIIGMIDHAIKTIFIPLAALYYMKVKVARDDSDESSRRWINRMEIIIVAGVYLSVVAMAIPLASRFNNYVILFNFVMVASCFFTTIRVKRHRRFKLAGMYWSLIFAIVLIFNVKTYFVGTHGSSTQKVYMVYYPYESRLDPQDNQDREIIFRLYKHMK